MKQYALPIALLLALASCQKESIKEHVVAAVSNTSNSFVKPARQKQIFKTVDDNIGGYLELTPKGYATHPDKKYPLIIFATAIAQFGNGTTDLYKVATVSLPKVIADGRFPDTFKVGNKSFSFIVLSPQFKTTPLTTHLTDMLNFAIKNYRVDTTRIYFVGMGVGAADIWYYSASKGKRLAAIVPITSTAKCDSNWARGVAKQALPIWAFHNRFDTVVTSTNTINWVNMTTAFNPSITPRLTLFNEYKHDAWNQAADPAYKEEDKNIYQWMLQYKRTF